MANIDTIQARALQIVQDQKPFVVEQTDLIESCVRAAVEEHNANYPAESCPTLVSNGEKIQDLPAGFIDRFSEIKRVEYPTLEEGGDPNGMDKRHWLKVRRLNGFKLLFIKNLPSNGKNWAMLFTLPHAVDASTYAAHEVEAVSYLAAAHVAESLSARMAQGLEMSIPAEAVDFGDKPAVFQQLATAWRKTYKNIMSPKKEDAETESNTTFERITWDSPQRFNREKAFGEY